MKISPSSLKGSVKPPNSKSISHRALILSALSSGTSSISGLLESEDVEATRKGLQRFGSDIETDAVNVRVKNSIHQSAEEVDCANSGTTLRFLMGLAALFDEPTRLSGDQSLNQRPIGILGRSLSEMGAIVTSTNAPPVSISGPLIQDDLEIEIPGNVSSQFISALLVLSSVRGDFSTKIDVRPPFVSQPYVRLTEKMLLDRGITMRSKPEVFEVEGQDTLQNKDQVIPVDFSSAANYIAASVLSDNEIKVEGNFGSLPQADREIIRIVQALGGNLKVSSNSITGVGSSLTGAKINLSDSPDLFPILCLIGSQAEGQTELYGAEHLKYKESNRIEVTVEILSSLGVDIKSTQTGAIIHKSDIRGAKIVDPHGDHRLAMMAAIAGTISQKPIEIMNSDCVKVSYPHFFTDLANLGDNK